MNGYSPKNLFNSSEADAQSLSAPSNVQVGEEAGLSAGGATRGLRVELKLSSTSGSIVYKLQHRTLTGWTDLAGANATFTQSGDGEYSMTQLYSRTADEPNFPLKKQLRVVATGAGSADVDKIVILQEL